MLVSLERKVVLVISWGKEIELSDRVRDKYTHTHTHAHTYTHTTHHTHTHTTQREREIKKNKTFPIKVILCPMISFVS